MSRHWRRTGSPTGGRARSCPRRSTWCTSPMAVNHPTRRPPNCAAGSMANAGPTRNAAIGHTKLRTVLDATMADDARDRLINAAAWDAVAESQERAETMPRPPRDRFNWTQFRGWGPGEELFGDLRGLRVLEVGCGP